MAEKHGDASHSGDTRLLESRLGALLAVLQSFDSYETLAEWVAGKRGGLVALTVLEAWKASLRLRRLCLMEPGRLMQSFAPGGTPEETFSSILKRLGSASPLRLRVGSLSAPPVAPERCSALRMLVAGETLHVLQPLVYLVLLQLCGARIGTRLLGRRVRYLPWLTALAMEAGSLALCLRSVRSLQQQQLTATAIRRESHGRDNEFELQHRRRLLVFFLARPAARAAAVHMLSAGAAAARRRGRPSSMLESALELVRTLETAIWARYFRMAVT